nr:3-oxoacyl-[acyl-carrier-protein] synthase III C-terminal domain-containing protein [uncultured Cellulosilyticum sp.]
MKNVKIRGIEVYRPENFIHIDDIISEFEKKGKDIEVLAKEFFGKEIIHISKDNKENSLTMAIEAAKKVLTTTKLEGKDIDMIVLSSMLPEYVSPPSAMLIHKAINGKSNTLCYDINVNCIGMTVAMNQICKQITNDKNINRVLLIGSDYNRIHVEEDNENMLSNLGDAACAIILEKTDEECGLIDSEYFIDTSTIDTVAMPRCGSSHIHEVDKKELRSKMQATPGDIAVVIEHIKNMLERNDLTINDISMCCFSQAVLFIIEQIREELSIPEEKSIYIGNKYGYTGTSSPFIALYEAIKEKRVKRGDNILFWTAGAQLQYVFAIMKY